MRWRVRPLAGFKTYEMEDDVTKDLSEFALANAIFSALVEGHACEISSRYVYIHSLCFFWVWFSALTLILTLFLLLTSNLQPLKRLKLLTKTKQNKKQNKSRNAMDNASKNAGDMIGSLTLQYNRGRQAAITNELVDIITGASAL